LLKSNTFVKDDIVGAEVGTAVGSREIVGITVGRVVGKAVGRKVIVGIGVGAADGSGLDTNSKLKDDIVVVAAPS
jgi:hypothetical protein